MNLNTLAFLIRPDVTTVSVIFEANSHKAYIFKCTNQLAEQLQPGSQVVIHCSNGFRAVQVVEVHGDPKLDPADDIEYDWIVQLVNTSHYEQQVKQENAIAEKLRNKRKLTQRQQALAALGISNPDEFLKSLTGSTDDV